MTIKIGIAGVSGRMGREIARRTHNSGVKISAGLVSENSKHIGTDIGELTGAKKLGINTTSNVSEFINASPVVIDFTMPIPGIALIEEAARQGRPVVSGVTGLEPAQIERMRELSKNIPILWSANMSLGVNALRLVVEQAARLLADFDIEIFESHHANKVDAPSGTALLLGEAAATGRGVQLADMRDPAREGLSDKRRKNRIGFASARGGDVIGEHTVYLYGAGETVELTHRARERGIFAIGAIKAAIWLHAQEPGFYSFNDMLAQKF